MAQFPLFFWGNIFNSLCQLTINVEWGGGIGRVPAPGPRLRKLAPKIFNTLHLDFFQVNTNAYII